jgi:hypothetical protein
LGNEGRSNVLCVACDDSRVAGSGSAIPIDSFVASQTFRRERAAQPGGVEIHVPSWIGRGDALTQEGRYQVIDGNLHIRFASQIAQEQIIPRDRAYGPMVGRWERSEHEGTSIWHFRPDGRLLIVDHGNTVEYKAGRDRFRNFLSKDFTSP